MRKVLCTGGAALFNNMDIWKLLYIFIPFLYTAKKNSIYSELTGQFELYSDDNGGTKTCLFNAMPVDM